MSETMSANFGAYFVTHINVSGRELPILFRSLFRSRKVDNVWCPLSYCCTFICSNVLSELRPVSWLPCEHVCLNQRARRDPFCGV